MPTVHDSSEEQDCGDLQSGQMTSVSSEHKSTKVRLVTPDIFTAQLKETQKVLQNILSAYPGVSSLLSPPNADRKVSAVVPQSQSDFAKPMRHGGRDAADVLPLPFPPLMTASENYISYMAEGYIDESANVDLR